jgi:hypothetical protein
MLLLEGYISNFTCARYSHGHGISSVVVIQLTLAVKQVLYISNPTLEFLTRMLCVILIFIMCDRISVKEMLKSVIMSNDNKA